VTDSLACNPNRPAPTHSRYNKSSACSNCSPSIPPPRPVYMILLLLGEEDRFSNLENTHEKKHNDILKIWP